MSERIELVRGWFDRWNGGDRFTPEELHPDVEVITQLQPEPFHGPDGFRTWIAEIDDQFQSWQVVAEEWHDLGDDCVLAVGHITLRGHGSGVAFDQPAGWIVEIDGERLRRMRTFLEPATALEAAGLGEKQ